MIDQARSLGYRLTTLGECLGDPAVNWYRDPVTGEPYGASGLNTSATAPTSQPSSPDLTSSSTGPPASASVAASFSSSALVEPSPTPVPNVKFGAGTSPQDRPGFSPIGSSRTTTTILAPAATDAPPKAPLKSDATRVICSTSVILGLTLFSWLVQGSHA